ncbi:hypothetical protein QQ045_027996 [Rhodiola kirilowii]
MLHLKEKNYWFIDEDAANHFPSLITDEDGETVIPALPPLSNGSVCADDVLHEKSFSSSKISGEMMYGDQAEEQRVACSALTTKVKKIKRKNVGDAEFGGSGSNNGQGGMVCHITIERKRRKKMNENLAILRTLMPCFYAKRGDQASIIEGVVNYITELQQVLQSLESEKHKKLVFYEVPNPRIILSSPTTTTYVGNELVAHAKSTMAAVEVKFSSPYLILKTVSCIIYGQAAKIIAKLEELSLEALQVTINTTDEKTMLNCFTIKIGFDCELSAEEVAQRVLQTFQ